MAVAKVVSLLRSDKPGALALTGPTGCGKRHAIAEAARQAGVAVTHHDLAQGAIQWGRLGRQQLTSTGLVRSVHVISNASEHFLKDFAFAKRTQAKIILVADDAGPSMRASGVPVARMQPMSADAMAKQLFHEDGWDAEAALRCAQVAQGDWRKLRSTAEIFRHGNELTADTDLVESSRKDATMSALHPSLAANQVLNGTADPGWALDPMVFAWTERNLGLHCDSIEEMARKQELAALADVMQTDAIKCQEPCHVGPELFALGARNPWKRVQHTFGLYANPWQKTKRRWPCSRRATTDSGRRLLGSSRPLWPKSARKRLAACRWHLPAPSARAGTPRLRRQPLPARRRLGRELDDSSAYKWQR